MKMRLLYLDLPTYKPTFYPKSNRLLGELSNYMLGACNALQCTPHMHHPIQKKTPPSISVRTLDKHTLPALPARFARQQSKAMQCNAS